MAVGVAGTTVASGQTTTSTCTLLRLVGPSTGTVRAPAVVGPDGAPATPPVGSHNATDGHGDIVVANKNGVHLTTHTGLAPGSFPWHITNQSGNYQ